MNKTIFTLFGAAILVAAANAQVGYTGGSYTQNFDSLPSTGTANTWTDNSTLVGWYSSRVILFADDGSSNAGRLSSAGTTGSGERSLASLASGSTTTVLRGLQLTNNTGATIDNFTLAYFGEQWRSSTSQVNSLTFDFRVGGTTLAGADYTAFSGLDFVGAAPVTTNGALDGNANRTSISSTVTGISWAAGDSLWLRWSDVDNTGSDALLGIDDLNFSTQAVPEPATMAALGLGAIALIKKRRKK